MRRNRKWLLLLASIPILSCLCLGLLAGLGASASGEREATRTATTQFLEPLRALCTGQGGGVAGTAAYAPGPGIHPVLAFRARDAGAFDRDTRVGTGDWAPSALAETQLVACLEERWVTIESCPYNTRGTGSARFVDRSQHHVKLRLFAARSGASVAETTLTGSEPRACQDEETFTKGTTRETVSGEAVTPSAIQAWLRPHVAP